MSVRNIFILFFSTLAVSLVILILFFSLFFKNFDNAISFDTKLPESAPDVKGVFSNSSTSPYSKSDGVVHATINVPPDTRSQQNAASITPKDPEVGIGADTTQEEGITVDQPNETDVIVPKADTTTSPAETPGEVKPSAPSDLAEPPGNKAVKEKGHPAPTEGETYGIKGEKSGNAMPSRGQTKQTEALPVKPTLPKKAAYQVYLDGFSSKEAAQNNANELKAQGLNPIVKENGGKPVVQLGTFNTREYADALAGRAGAKVKNTEQ
jgi:hypothetical protein